MSNPIKPIPAGCHALPGYILDVFDGSAWITQDGQVTDKWHERGVWPTLEAAGEMMERCVNAEASDRAAGQTRTKAAEPGSLR